MTTRKPLVSKIILDVKQSADTGADRRGGCIGGNCRPHIVVCPGYGREKFPFPDAATLVVRALERIKNQQAAVSENADGSSLNENSDEELDEDVDVYFAPAISGLELKTLRRKKQSQISPKNLPLGKVQALIPSLNLPGEESVDATLLVAAGGLSALLNDGKFDAIVAERFDAQSARVSWARANMHSKYWPAIDSLAEQLEQLRTVYLASLPRAVDGLRAYNPEVPESQLLEVAIDALDEELTPIIDILRIWTDAFSQARSGKYKELASIIFCVEQAHYLFEGTDPSSTASAEVKARLNSLIFHIGCVYVARFSSAGPATLPAGPVGAHAFEVPHDERNVIGIMLILYMHEFRHDIFHDVVGLGSELIAVLARAISDASKKGELVLSQKSVSIGNQKVPLLNLLIKFFVDTIGEVDADISGGVLLCGPAYLYNMVSTFCAFNSQDKGIFNTEQLLRTESYYEFSEGSGGGQALSFLPHPPDYIRAYIVAAALDEIGFVKEAQQCRKLADQAVGAGNLPEVITWKCLSDQPEHSDIVISVEDIKALAPVVAMALIRTPLKSLGGVSTVEITNWTEEREERAQCLARLIMEDKSELPTDKGHIHVTYVISAATYAYWGLCKSGYQPRNAAAIVQRNALSMIEQVRGRFEKRIAAA